MKYNFLQVDGLFFELLETPENINYHVKILDGNSVLYELEMKSGMWAKYDRKYLSNYYVEIWKGKKLIEKISFLEHLKGKRVFISYESSSLGDGLAWIPYCLEMKKKHGCEIIVSTFHNWMYENKYPELKFVPRGGKADNIHAMYQIGWFYDSKKEPVHPATIPLQQAASNILFLPFQEIKPEINFTAKKRPFEEKYVTISTKSTSQCKQWYYWQELVNLLIEKGYKVVELSKDYDKLDNVIYPNDKSIESVMNYLHHSEFFIGLSSGISWLSWALGKHVYMISNFSVDNHEFTTNCTRITNKSVCYGCWNNPKFKFDKGNWWWCPEHEDTHRQFECHKSISAQKVFQALSLNQI